MQLGPILVRRSCKLKINKSLTPLWILIFGISLGLLIYILIQNVPALGHNIPTSDVSSDYFRGLVTAVLLGGVVFILPVHFNERVPLLLLWILRSTLTLGFMLYYEYRYGLDAYAYFYEAVNSQTITQTYKSTLEGTQTMILITKTIVEYIPLFKSYHALKVFFSFFGFLGSYLFYRSYSRYFSRSDIRLLYLLGAFPSIVFWSSILGKDPLTFFGISVFFYGALQIFKKFRIRHLALLVLGLLIMSSIRLWLVILFLMPFLLIYFFNSRSNLLIKTATSAVGLALVAFYSETILTSFQVESSKEALSLVNRISKSWSYGGSGQSVAELTSASSIVKFLPIGMFTALFRPLPGEIFNPFGLLSGFENLILLMLFTYSLFRIEFNFFKDRFTQYMTLTILIWSMFYGFISYQNLGTAVRFKLQILPFLILFIYHCVFVNKQKINSSVMSS